MIKDKFKLKDSVQYVKYMGSKTKILPFVIEGIEDVYEGGVICDLFAGSCTLAGALGSQAPIVSNDIQEYSAILAKAYLTDWNNSTTTSDKIIETAEAYFDEHYRDLIMAYRYPLEPTLKEFNKIEHASQKLINRPFQNEWHLFTKYYSGTWWSAEQCAWIDSLRKAIEDEKDNPAYNTMLSSLMYSMAYNSQGTGHYAQYRDAKTDSSMKDIMIYRRKSIPEYFSRKFEVALASLQKQPSSLSHKILSSDYIECLKTIKNATVYADPPYCFVHYSRFYHALETIVLYDYPNIQHKNGKMVKGRYREERHQSPFSIRTKVRGAFDEMFRIIAKNNCSMVLSYSDTGMIKLEELMEVVHQRFETHFIEVKSMDHQHMTMGRANDRNRNVQELLIIVKPL